MAIRTDARTVRSFVNWMPSQYCNKGSKSCQYITLSDRHRTVPQFVVMGQQSSSLREELEAARRIGNALRRTLERVHKFEPQR